MRRFAATLAVLTIVLHLSAAARAQGEDQKLELRGEEVLLDLVAVDGKGRPVLDLRPGEVEVYENGKRQDVTSFGLLETSADAPADQRVPAQLSASPFRRMNLVMIVVDRTSVQPLNLKAIDAAASEFVEKRLAPNDLVAVFALGSRLLMVQNFTNDRARLVEALRRATSGVEGPLEPVLTATGDARDARIFESPATVDSGLTGEARAAAETLNKLAQTSEAVVAYVSEQVQARSLVQGLFALLRTYQSIPDRKSVVLYSEGVAVDSAVASQFTSLVSLANRTGFTFYTVDAGGLRTNPGAEARASALTPIGIQNDVTRDRTLVHGGNSELGRAERSLRTDDNAALSRIAGETGGLFIRNTNDLRQGLERLAGDLRAHYALTYAPRDATPDGTYRAIEVRTARKDVKVRTRAGYFAVPGGSGSILLPYELPVLAVLNAAAERRPSDLRAGARTEHFAAADGWLVPVLVGVSGEGLDPLPAAKGAKPDAPLAFEVDAVAFVRDASRAVVAKLSRRTVFGVERGTLEEFRKTFYALPPFADRVVLGAGSYTVTVAVYDPVSKRATVLESALALGDPPPSGGAALSSLVLGRGAQKVAAAAGSDPFLLPGGMRVDLRPDARFAKSLGDRLVPYFRFYGKPGAEYRMKIDFARDGKTVVSTGHEPLPVDAAGEAVVARVFQLDGFAPGAYTARVTVTSAGAAPLTAEVEFRVEP